MKASVLIIHHPNPESVKFGADFATDFAQAKDIQYPVIAFAAEPLPHALQFLERAQREAPQAQLVCCLTHWDESNLHAITTQSKTAPLITDYDSKEFENVIQLAVERHHEAQQQSDFMLLTQDQNQKLKTASTELQALVDKHEKKLLRAQKRILNLNAQADALHKSLMAVHAAQSVAEIETQLRSALAQALDLSWVRIFIHASEHLDNQLDRIQGQALYRETLQIGPRTIGRIVYARQNNKSFNKNEEESLLQITESVALALDRLAKLDQAEHLKLQWESTFDAISEPFCLTDEKFNIIRTNKAFLTTTGVKAQQVIGINCFSVFCGSSEPTQLAPSPNALILQRQTKGQAEPSSYEVTSQRIRMRPGGTEGSIILVLFRDITEQKKIEKQIFESSKMAELGTISSSIAHDINNPLGGMMNFLQLIKMDINSSHPMFDDIVQMEQAAQRCKEIVENLLRFSRREDSQKAELVNLVDVLNQSLKIIELQTRSVGIQLEFTPPKNEHKILGHFNLLSQALSHILQNAYDAIAEKLQQTPGYNGQIKVAFDTLENGSELTIIDNGIGISPEHQSKILNPLFSTKNKNKYQGLGLTLAYQIVSEHHGRLEIFSQPNVGTTVKISFANV